MFWICCHENRAIAGETRAVSRTLEDRMSSISDRLRRAHPQSDEGALRHEAADEITRHLARVAELEGALQGSNANCDRMASLAIDNARDILRLTARVEELEGALKEIYKRGLYHQSGGYKNGFYANFKTARLALGIPHMSFDTARAALTQPAEKGKEPQS
jgi:hypothetical protein